MIKSEFLQKCHDLRWTQSELEEDLDAVIQSAIEDHERSKKTIKAKAHQLTPNKKWVVWSEDGKYLPTRSSFDHFDIYIIINEP